jgi:hypothetical protein
VATTGCTGVPAGAAAIAANGTVIADAGNQPGYITFYAGDVPTPNASNLNFVPGQVAPNAFTVALAGDGSFNSFASATADLVVDITGYFDTNAANGFLYHSLSAPVRLVDTRGGQSACSTPNAPIRGGTALQTVATGNCTGIPGTAAAIIGNGTVVADAGGGPGFVTFYPSDKALPLASNLNYVPGDVVPNQFTVALASDGSFKGYASTTTDLVVDVSGYYATS